MKNQQIQGFSNSKNNRNHNSDCIFRSDHQKAKMKYEVVKVDEALNSMRVNGCCETCWQIGKPGVENNLLAVW